MHQSPQYCIYYLTNFPIYWYWFIIWAHEIHVVDIYVPVPVVLYNVFNMGPVYCMWVDPTIMCVCTTTCVITFSTFHFLKNSPTLFRFLFYSTIKLKIQIKQRNKSKYRVFWCGVFFDYMLNGESGVIRIKKLIGSSLTRISWCGF